MNEPKNRPKLQPVDPPEADRPAVEPLKATARDVEGRPVGGAGADEPPAVIATGPRPAVEPGAVTRRYRCYGCQVDGSPKLGFDFVAGADDADVRCPSCGLVKADPKGSQLIVPVHVIHYEPPLETDQSVLVEGRPSVRGRQARVRRSVGSDRVACDGDGAGSATARGLHRSAEPAAVTCPACLGSEGMKARKAAELDPRFDLPVSPAAGGRLEFRGLPDDAKISTDS